MGKTTNKFDQLVEDLLSGELTHNLIQIAYRTWIRRRDDIPEEVKTLLAGKSESDPGLLYDQFKIISSTVGTMELAARRGRSYKEYNI